MEWVLGVEGEGKRWMREIEVERGKEEEEEKERGREREGVGIEGKESKGRND